MRARMAAEAGPGFAISHMAALECLVGPFRQRDAASEGAYRAAFAGFTNLPVAAQIFEDAALLRAHFRLKTPDALHLAWAKHHSCAALWTNDRRFEAAGGNFVKVLTA